MFGRENIELSTFDLVSVLYNFMNFFFDDEVLSGLSFIYFAGNVCVYLR